MNSQQKLKLSEMIKEYGSKDMTENIRKIKHSSLIKKDVDTLLYNIKKGKNENECIHESNFYFQIILIFLIKFTKKVLIFLFYIIL